MKLKVKKILLIVAGCVSLIIGGIGIFLPFLPTTPLVILAAICFSSSSEKLYNLLLKSKYFGSYIEHYKNKTGVPKEIKRRAILFLWIVLGASIIISGELIKVLILIAVGICVTIHINSLKSRN